MISTNRQQAISDLKKEYETLKRGKESLLRILAESELPEQVYNSNAIESSTLTLKETEKILLEQEVMRDISVRELYEAKNLAIVLDYLSSRPELTINIDNILLLHQMLIGTIDNSIAGRLRKKGEYVRVGTHIPPAPEHLDRLLEDAIVEYNSNFGQFFLERIARFHLEFERIHPFNDGNGRIGRVLINAQLAASGFPPIIIRNKSKREAYYPAFMDYVDNNKTTKMDVLLTLAITESLHKRITYLKGQSIIKFTDYAKQSGQSINTLLNAARRQTIPAFREKGVWKIGV